MSNLTTVCPCLLSQMGVQGQFGTSQRDTVHCVLIGSSVIPAGIISVLLHNISLQLTTDLPVLLPCIKFKMKIAWARCANRNILYFKINCIVYTDVEILTIVNN